METITTIFSIIILIFSIVVHELAHGYMADYLGDKTPYLQGRLTLNPLPHMDLFGSLILPGLLVLSGSGMVIGWAKPVEFDPRQLRYGKYGHLLVALAGPVSNIFIAVVFSMIIRFFGTVLDPQMLGIFVIIVLINLVLAVFNMIPVPPLDGHHILFSLTPSYGIWGRIKYFLQHYSLVIMLAIVFFAWQVIFPVIPWIFKIFTGMSL